MSHWQSKPVRRRGSITPLMAIMLVVVMALMSLGVDLGYIALVRTQLQSAADAAALAGCSQLLDQSLLQGGSQTTATTLAQQQAYNFANNNTAGGVALSPKLNTHNREEGDIVCGYFANPCDRTQSMSLNPPAGALYNAVQVRLYRASSHASTGNGSLSLFFAKALGMDSTDLQATATACIQGGVLGFKMQTPGRDFCALLPYTLKYSDWVDQVVNGNGPDAWTRTTPSAPFPYAPNGANVSAGADGIHEVKLFPAVNNGGGSGVTPGNFGQVDIGLPNNSTADVKRQIASGVSASDLAWYTASNGYTNGCAMTADPSSPTGYSMMLQGDTGISAGVQTDLQNIVGQARVIPLYSNVTGNGNNAQYTICAFVGVTICNVKLTGSTTLKSITIQPCWVIEPNAVCGGTEQTSQYVVQSLALVR